MATVLIIGAGGVGSVTAHKCAMNSDTFTKIHLASRTIGKPNAIKKDIRKRWKVDIATHTVDADRASDVAALIRKTKPAVVINVALPYQDLTIMDACLATRVHYIDTANYEPRDEAHFEYSWQWAYRNKFKKAGLMAILGAGFDPGVTNAYCAYLLKKYFDKVRFVDILDANAGSHEKAFATNFNPEINIREVTQEVKHWRKGKWVKTPPVMNKGSVHFTFNYPVAGKRESYLLFHEEMESLAKNLPGLERMRFWMTFSENYLTHLRVMENIGITRIDPIDYEGKKIVPIQFLKKLLPDPASLATKYTGKTVIGCIVTGTKGNPSTPLRAGKESTKYIYNVCDHARCFKEVGSQAISYTAGVPPVVAAMMLLQGKWKGAGVFNVEELDPEPFLKTLAKNGLPFKIVNHKPLPAHLGTTK
ncbi:saccharopine dehydrogenase [Candidatus Kaiserbacteria bacterium RIFCSPHIGHO2_01_FULL_55_17]|uniref:Saccharopine dehydrogenase n=1 Tax=Candidatus Kaiserbacteria bacterium RIFCSPHIGHO2_01_FULL_55_17 TaxID=1798484 RepID=A0A1F6D8W8_9BACT|nr:MAG: saccharopine dehydrogenase [Candidatus Kaiserbacteria bacterium RIFCSPHIGHO2_01_FULL_55_17]